MTALTSHVQVAVVAALVTAEPVTSIVGATPDGPAVFARNQKFDAVYPRVTVAPPQRIPVATTCGTSADMVVTLHSWAKGDDASLVAADLADALIVALRGGIVVQGWKLSSWTVLSSRPVGDADPTIEHFVTEFRFSFHGAG